MIAIKGRLRRSERMIRTACMMIVFAVLVWPVRADSFRRQIEAEWGEAGRMSPGPGAAAGGSSASPAGT